MRHYLRNRKSAIFSWYHFVILILQLIESFSYQFIPSGGKLDPYNIFFRASLVPSRALKVINLTHKYIYKQLSLDYFLKLFVQSFRELRYLYKIQDYFRGHFIPWGRLSEESCHPFRLKHVLSKFAWSTVLVARIYASQQLWTLKDNPELKFDTFFVVTDEAKVEAVRV